MWQAIASHLRAGLLVVVVAALWWSPVSALPAAGRRAPEIIGQAWLNSPSLSMKALGGRVVLVEFWTYG